MTPKERAAMQQALEALLRSIPDEALLMYVPEEADEFHRKAITALREALAEQAKQEPVACGCGATAYCLIRHTNLPEHNFTPICLSCLQKHKQNAQEVNEHEMNNFGGAYGLVTWETKPLYAAPVPITTPDVCGEVCVRAKLCYGCNKNLEEANASWMSHDELKAYWSGYGNGKQKALSEPVAFKFPREPKPEQSMGWTIDHKVIRSVDAEIEDNEFKPCCESVEQVLLALEKVYAAPVRTKDLTDDEINEVLWRGGPFESVIDSIRAVIAADREKNK